MCKENSIELEITELEYIGNLEEMINEYDQELKLIKEQFDIFYKKIEPLSNIINSVREVMLPALKKLTKNNKDIEVYKKFQNDYLFNISNELNDVKNKLNEMNKGA